MRILNGAGPGSEAIARELSDFVASDLRIRRLCTVGALPFLGMALWNWGVILGLVWASEASASSFVYFAACLLIAGRQHAFLALTHDATHGRISPNRRWNDLLSNCLFAFPVFFDTDVYRQNHLKHHAHLNTEQDPDWVRKINLPQWQFPISLGYTARTYPKFLFWNGPKEWIMIMLYFSQILPLQNLRKREVQRGLVARTFYYGAFALALTYASGWGLFLKYWAFPLLFLFPSLQRVRSVAEHFGLARAHELNSSRNVLAPWYERMLFAPHNVHFHLAHHLVPAVPFYRLPRLQKLLLENPVYRELAHENTSYVLPSSRSLARDLFKEFQAAESNSATDTAKRAA